jgi:nitroreductase
VAAFFHKFVLKIASVASDRCAILRQTNKGKFIMAETSIDLSSLNLFDVLYTTRAMRRLKPDPVSDDLVIKILKAGTRAANGANLQTWHFIVIKDPAIKKAVQVWYKKAFDEFVSPRYADNPTPAGSSAEKYHRQHMAVEYLTDHFHEAPIWIVACLKHDNPLIPPDRKAGASIYPAVQNMLLAARALGLGASLTTRHLFFEEESEKALKLPPGMRSYAILPIGYPMGNFGSVGRGDLREFVSLDRVGQSWDALDTSH